MIPSYCIYEFYVQVWITLIDYAVFLYELIVRPLTPSEKEEFYELNMKYWYSDILTVRNIIHFYNV
jgi:hypothetical protein